MVTVTRSISVAAGVFAPGHLGPLTQVIPLELVDAVLAQTGRTERRVRMIPSRVALYLVLAMGLFGQVGAVGVWSKLTSGLAGLPVARPSEKALRDARRRIGAEPLQALFEVLAGPLAQPRTPGARYRGWRTVAFDGCSSTKIPDTAANRALYGRAPVRHGRSGYPMLMLMTLVETGTRALIGAVFGPIGTGEIAWAEKLLGRLAPSMLLLDDRGFDADGFLVKIAATGAQFLVRASARRRPPVLARLPDGSYLTVIAGLRLRVIEAEITVTGADGTALTGTYRLITTLLSHRLDPAPALIALYHERWEIEVAYLAIRHTLLDGRVLRSKDPAGLAQEMWAILTLYQALRTVMCEAAESVPGTDPDRMRFALALETARTHTTLREPRREHRPARPDRPRRAGRAQPRPPRPPQPAQTQIPRQPLHLQRPHPPDRQHPDHHHRHPSPDTRATTRTERTPGRARETAREKPRPRPVPASPRPGPIPTRDHRPPRDPRPRAHQPTRHQTQPLAPPRTTDQNRPRHLQDQGNTP